MPRYQYLSINGTQRPSINDTLPETNVDPETEKRETGVYVYL